MTKDVQEATIAIRDDNQDRQLYREKAVIFKCYKRACWTNAKRGQNWRVERFLL
jgi:hypothetical protein